MKILMIRHGDPDYENDCLTEKGRREAALLAERIAPMDIAAYYVSPMGRARETAEYTLKKAGRTAEVCNWLHEFHEAVQDGGEPRVTWDMLPENWTKVKEYFSKHEWLDTDAMRAADMERKVKAVCEGLDGLLRRWGLEREGDAYRVVKKCDDTIALYCHFGVTCLMAAHLLGISPLLVWQGFNAEPTAVAVFCTDDRHGDVVNFRMHCFGDTSHLSSPDGVFPPPVPLEARD